MQHSLICECSKYLSCLVMVQTRKFSQESYGSSIKWIILKRFRLVKFILLLIITSKLLYNILSNVPALMKLYWECPKSVLPELLLLNYREYKRVIRRSTIHNPILKNL